MSAPGPIVARLRRPLLGALGSTLVAGAILAWNASSLQEARQENAAAGLRKQETEQKLKQAMAEAGNIGERTRRYQQLRESGVIGEEQRQQWVAALQAIQQERQPLSLDYELGAKTPLPGGHDHSRSFASRLLLQLEVRHEADLLQLITRLEREIGALTAWQNCHLARSENSSPGLSARCEISLITLLPGTEAR